MYRSTHVFCGVAVEVTSPLPLWEEDEAAVFQQNTEKPQLQVQLEAVDALPEPAGVLCAKKEEKRVWRDKNRVFLKKKDICRQTPHMLVQYDLDDISVVKAFVRKEDWHWATRTKYLWTGISLQQLLLHFQSLLLHASYINCGGEGILFTASSQVGKSTQAELWWKYRGAEIINGDKAGISLRAVPQVHGVPFSGTSGICKNVTLPLKAVVVLSQAPENTVQKMRPSQAVQALFANTFVDDSVPEEWSMALQLLLQLTESVPVYSLACTPDERAVEALEKIL